MSDSQETPWIDNPNAPKVPHWLYIEEKAYFAGIIIASILYGSYKAAQFAYPYSICPFGSF